MLAQYLLKNLQQFVPPQLLRKVPGHQTSHPPRELLTLQNTTPVTLGGWPSLALNLRAMKHNGKPIALSDRSCSRVWWYSGLTYAASATMACLDQLE